MVVLLGKLGVEKVLDFRVGGSGELMLLAEGNKRVLRAKR